MIPIEGFGKNVTGGAGCPVYTVTNGAATGAGTFSEIISAHRSNAIIQFDPSVITFMTPGNRYIGSNITIDGLANGRSGVIKDGTMAAKMGLYIAGPASNVIIRGINFRGNMYGGHGAYDLLSTDGAAGVVDGVLVERCTFYNASDGAFDLSGSSSNVTVQACLFYETAKVCLVKYGTIGNVSYHHNVFVFNGERNPQIRGDVGPFELVNNIVLINSVAPGYPAGYAIWREMDGGSISPYGLRVWNSITEVVGNVVLNVRGNVFLGDRAQTQIITDVGASDAGLYFDPQGTGTDSNYWNGSPAVFSPRVTPNDIPEEFQITRHPIWALKSMLPEVGCPLRTGNDQARLDAVAAALGDDMPATLTTVQSVSVSITINDSEGQSAPVEGVPVWTSSDPAGLSVAPAPDGFSAVLTADIVGTYTVTVTVDADLGAGVVPLERSLTVNVVPAQASDIVFTVGIPY